MSLAHAEPQEAAADVNANGVFQRTTNAITEGGTTDNYQVSYHGQTVAHIDTLVPLLRERADVQRRARQGQHDAEEGCIKGSVMNWKDGITTRAVLYDIAQLKGVDGSIPTCRSRAPISKRGRRNRA